MSLFLNGISVTHNNRIPPLRTSSPAGMVLSTTGDEYQGQSYRNWDNILIVPKIHAGAVCTRARAPHVSVWVPLEQGLGIGSSSKNYARRRQISSDHPAGPGFSEYTTDVSPSTFSQPPAFFLMTMATSTFLSMGMSLALSPRPTVFSALP